MKRQRLQALRKGADIRGVVIGLNVPARGHDNLKQSGREKGIQALMTVNLLKRLESSVHAFRLILEGLAHNHRRALEQIALFQSTGKQVSIADVSPAFAAVEPDEEGEFPDPEDIRIGEKVQINLADMDVPSWEQELRADLQTIEGLLSEMRKISPAEDAKLQHIKTTILSKLASPINPGNRKS